jgi:putative methionine-R-sulfoxide reductase with GAF domain
MKEVDCSKYLGVDIDRDGRIKSEIRYRVSEGEKVIGVLKKI